MQTTTTQRAVEQRPRAGTYGEYLDGLFAEMQRRPSLAYLAAYLRDYGRERALLPYTARDATAPDVKAIHARGCDWLYEQRLWDIREHARAIIEGAEPWPQRLMAWKVISELRYYHGGGRRPAWLDPRDWPDPTRPPEYREPKSRKAVSAIKARINAKRRERRAAR